MLSCRTIAGSLLLFTLAFHSHAQKLFVDSNAYNTWPAIGARAVTNKGNFLFYVVRDPLNKHDTLFIQSTGGQWKAEYLDSQSPAFSQNSKYLFFQCHDTLFTLVLGTSSLQYQQGIVGNFTIQSHGKYDDFLLYSTKKDPGHLVIHPVNGGRDIYIPSPENHWYDSATGAIAYLTKEVDSSINQFHLKYLRLDDSSVTDIFGGEPVENLLFNRDGSAATLLSRDPVGRKTIWYYQFRPAHLVKLADNHSPGIDSGLSVDNILTINADNTQVFFTLATKPQRIPGPGIDVWSYKDPKLQSQQLHELQSGSTSQQCTAAINISTGRVLILEQKGQAVMDLDGNLSMDHWAILQEHGPGDEYGEWNWNKAATSSFSLLSLQDGSRRRMPLETASNYFLTLSPDEKYVLFYDPKKSGYCSYEVASGVIRDLTTTIETKWTNVSTDDRSDEKYNAIGIAGFTDDHRFALIYDRYDIYKVDLTAKVAPVVLTKGYGNANHIVFRVLDGSKTFSPLRSVILQAFNNTNKDAGFYRLSLGSHPQLDSLSIRPVGSSLACMARDTPAYAVFQGDAASFPNLYFSQDLRHFTPITNLHPESKYNWITSELVIWRLPNGKPSQGILYKPENFDPRKKYPLILHYYEQLSDRLHSFIFPQASGFDIQIPLYVSNGYLVFTPDIHYTIGHPGQSAFDCIVSAAKLLAHRNYVDPKRMGLQGTSFGGFETNYVITHTNLFAAAMSSSGMTDCISSYGSIAGDGSSHQRGYELYRVRMGAPLSQIPDLYAANSPVLRAKFVTTPLLMMTNSLDGDVPCQQGIELFTALRRLKKKVWMLQYDGEGHQLTDNVHKRDLTIRVFQFFNYYLKNETPPVWMTIGIPADRKGLDSGLQPDTTGRIP